MFPAIQQATVKDISPPTAVVDEVMCFMVAAVQAETHLRSPLSEVISCTDASPTGGASAVATRFKSGVVKVPASVVEESECGECHTPFSDVPGSGKYPCSRNCGVRLCSVACCFTHQQHSCQRADLWTPLFGERFSGGNYPLTKACALEGIGIQPPLDKEVEGLEWEFFSPEGKKTLDRHESSPALAASHWAPECKTFSAARGKPIQLASGRWTQGPKALRSVDQPWGFKNIGKQDQIKVRQGNAMAKRSIQGCKEAHLGNRFFSLEHPWGSHMWKTPEAQELCQMDGVYVSCYSHCCFGGRRTKWQCLVHNCPQLHAALHRPRCDGHSDLLRYEVHERADGTLAFDTEGEAEYPWPWCRAFAKALKQALREKCPAPIGLRDLTLQNAIFSALKCSTRGMQNDAVARSAAAGSLLGGFNDDSWTGS